MPNVLVCLAEGFEDIEAVTPIDVLRRAGCTVVVAGLSPGPIASSRGLRVVPDVELDEAKDGDYDAVILPGGMPGAANLRDDARVRDIVQRLHRQQRVTAAICAAPIALHAAGILSGKTFTSHPAVEQDVAEMGQYSDSRVVVDGHLITSRGPGTAMEFAFALVAALCGPDKVAEVNAPMFAQIAGVAGA